MGETIPTWKPTSNPSVSVRLSGRKTNSDGGAFLLWEIWIVAVSVSGSSSNCRMIVIRPGFSTA